MARTVSTGIAIVVALGLFSETAAGQDITAGALSGTVLSAGATVPNLSQAFVTTTPANRAFVLTQVCTTRPDALRVNAGPQIGDIPLEQDRTCTQFVPGIAIPPNTNVNCFDQSGAGGALRCMLTGVLTK